MSGAIRNPKGMRRSIGPQSMGATPQMNRSAKDGARSSPHYGDEGVSHSPIAPRCLLTARYGRFTRDPRRPACVPAASRVSDPISESEVGNDAHAGVGERNSTSSARRTTRVTGDGGLWVIRGRTFVEWIGTGSVETDEKGAC